MNKLSMAPAFVLAMAMAAAAQEKPLTTKKDMTDTVKVNVSGNVVFDYIWRSGEITGIQSGTPGPGDSANTFEGEIGVRFDVEMSDKVAVIVEIGKERADGAFDPFNGDTAEGIVVRELRVVIGDFLTPGLQMEVGIPDWSFNVRGKGGAFVFDPRHSQSAMKNAIVGGVANTGADGAGTLGARASVPDELDPVGFYFKYVREQLQLDVVLLPAVVENGSPGNDEALYAVDLFYSLDNKGSRVGGILALSSGPGRDTGVITFGAGVDFMGIESLELFAEIYFQFGDAGADATGDAVDAGGVAFRLGGVWTAQGGTFSVGAMIDYLSGDGDAPADDTVDSFLSYENVNDLMILEDQFFGFDWDTNVLVFKVMAEFPLQIKAKNDLVLSAILGLARTNEDVEFGGAVGGKDALGTEFDARARWAITKQAGLHAAIALLFGSDILEESLGGSAVDGADDSAILYTVGADLRF